MNKKLNSKLLYLIMTFTMVYVSCQSSPTQNNNSAMSQLEKLEKNVANNPNNAKAHYDLGYYHAYTQRGRWVAAAKSFEKVLELDPNYRVGASFEVSPQNASRIGIETTTKIIFSNFSLSYLLADMYRTSATSTNTDIDIAVSENDKQNTLEKALAMLRRGYEIDITNGRNNNINLKIIYLGDIARTLDRLGRTDEANSTYTELSKITTITDTIASRIGIAVEAPKVASTQQTTPPSQTGQTQNVAATSEQAKYADFLYVTIDNGKTVRITGYTGTDRMISIPTQINSLPVTEIGEKAFYEKKLTGVTIPNGISLIGKYAFQSNGIRSLSIPASVRNIDDFAFDNNSIGSLNISNGVTRIGSSAFGSNNLSNVTIPESVTIIEACGFWCNPNISTITILNKRKITIGAGAFIAGMFDYQSSAKKITIGPNAELIIGPAPFGGGFEEVYKVRGAGVYGD